MSIRSYNDKSPILGKDVFIDETAVVIGDVEIGNDCSIWPNTVIRGDVNKIKIGDNTNIQDGCVLHVSHNNDKFNPEGGELIIGNNITVGHNATLHACTIKDYVLIGMGSVILDKVIIEQNVIVGAGSVVPPGKHLSSGYLYVGNPVRQLRPLIENEKELLRYSAESYVKLKNTYQ